MKFAIFTAIAALTLSVPTPTKSQEVCFLERKDGIRVNLEHICGGKVAQANPDTEFIAAYRRLAARESESELLLDTFNRNPQNYINTAKRICSGLRGGRSENELMRAWIKPWLDSSDNMNRAGIQLGGILFTLAPKYYCPEFSNLN